MNQTTALTNEKLSVLVLIDNLCDYEERLAITNIHALCEIVIVNCKELRLSRSKLYRVKNEAL